MGSVQALPRRYPGVRGPGVTQVGHVALGMRRAGSSAPVETRNGEYVSGNFFEPFGISGWRGRLFNNADQEGAPPVAVMSFHTWRGSTDPIRR